MIQLHEIRADFHSEEEPVDASSARFHEKLEEDSGLTVYIISLLSSVLIHFGVLSSDQSSSTQSEKPSLMLWPLTTFLSLLTKSRYYGKRLISVGCLILKYSILGHKGSGKSTLINLLAGMYNPDFGDIRCKRY